MLTLLPFGREVLEAVVAVAAVAVLLYISFWLIARLEHRRWMEFLRSRLFNAVSIGSTTALALVGFTAMYREGLETALLYQALVEFGEGLGVWIVVGLVAGLLALVLVAYLIFKLGRRIPVKTFLVFAVLLLMTTSVAFLGTRCAACRQRTWSLSLPSTACRARRSSCPKRWVTGPACRRWPARRPWSRCTRWVRRGC